MDIQKEREAFETWLFSTEKFKFRNKNFLFMLDEYGSYEDKPVLEHWETWQAAKAQAVPEWISTSERMPNEGEEVFVHYYGQISQATRDKKYSGGFKQRNCYGWESVSSYISHWMPKSIELPESYHFYYENDAKQKALTEAQEPAND
ncbi:DUF551 domain-containing protein [Acinetobacter pseudolwoffii]|uniref:DUF551 domain-containing protein n=1 Tax=Acinetobacter pseudolwoffii TaxID=2053287 RepID=UPI0021E426EA|nr:DUF551 domain-containing protein [Acinetobacter pseudolwoffii]